MMKKLFLSIGLLAISQVIGVVAEPLPCGSSRAVAAAAKHPGIYFSSQYTEKAVYRALSCAAHSSAPDVLKAGGIHGASDSDVVKYLVANPDKFRDCRKTLVVASDAPFNSSTPGFKKYFEMLVKSPVVDLRAYNTPSFGQLSQVPTANPRVGSRIDQYLATKKAFGDGDKPNAFDEFAALLQAKYANQSEAWLKTTVSGISKYRDSIQKTLPKSGQPIPNALEWQENIRAMNGFSKEDFQSLAHENIMHMFGIPQEEYSAILADPGLKRSVEWMGKLALTVGLGGAASDALNWYMYVAGIDPVACTKQNVGKLLAAARQVQEGLLNGTLTPEQKQRAELLQIMIQDGELDDMIAASNMHLANGGALDLSLFGTRNVINAIEKQGYLNGAETNGLTLHLVEDSESLNEKNALQGIKDFAKYFFKS